MTTTPTQPTERDKAIERLQHEVDLHNGPDNLLADLQVVLLAAKRLKAITDITGVGGEHLQFSLQLLTRAEKAEKRAQELERKFTEHSNAELLGETERCQFEAMKVRLKEAKKERGGMRDNIKCGACAESICCGSHMYPHDADCVYTELSQLHTENQEMSIELGENAKAIFQLRTEYNKALEALDEADDYLESQGYGWLMPIRKRIQPILSTPSAIETFKKEKVWISFGGKTNR